MSFLVTNLSIKFLNIFVETVLLLFENPVKKNFGQTSGSNGLRVSLQFLRSLQHFLLTAVTYKLPRRRSCAEGAAVPGEQLWLGSSCAGGTVVPGEQLWLGTSCAGEAAVPGELLRSRSSCAGGAAEDAESGLHLGGKVGWSLYQYTVRRR
jgi:hypothetical protein